MEKQESEFEMKPITNAEDTAFFEQPIKSSVEIRTSVRGKPIIRVKVAKGEESCLEGLILAAINTFKKTCNQVNKLVEEDKGILMFAKGTTPIHKEISTPKGIGKICIQCGKFKTEFLYPSNLCMDCHNLNKTGGKN